jgi:hypothetical protein
MQSSQKYLCLLLSHALLSSAVDSRDKWSSAYNTTLYNALSSCAQPCLAGVDASLKCWSYGCVCSENTLGENFINGTRFIESCVLNACQQATSTALGPALSAFQSLCGVPYFNVSATPTGTAGEQVTVTLSAIPTATFNRKCSSIWR